MGKIHQLKNNAGNKIYPVTIGDAIAVNGKTLTATISDLNSKVDGSTNADTVDTYHISVSPTAGSTAKTIYFVV